MTSQLDLWGNPIEEPVVVEEYHVTHARDQDSPACGDCAHVSFENLPAPSPRSRGITVWTCRLMVRSVEPDFGTCGRFQQHDWTAE